MRCSTAIRIAALVGLAPLLGTCVPEEEKSADGLFEVWCHVVNTSGQPVDGQWVTFSAAKYDYEGQLDPDSRFDSGGTTTSFDAGHPGAVSFQLGYTLHQRGEQMEQANFSCFVSLMAPDGSVNHVGAEMSVAYDQMVAQAGLMSLSMTVTLPPPD